MSEAGIMSRATQNNSKGEAKRAWNRVWRPYNSNWRGKGQFKC